MKLGIIGGSGLDDPGLLQDFSERDVETPYGLPSSSVVCGKLKGVDICVIARHGRKHEIPPTQINNRANIYALKEIGCTHIIATTAVGSLREEIQRGDFVIVDQFIDFTRHRNVSFHTDFRDGPKHTPMAEPFSAYLRKKILACCQELGIRHHSKGTVVTIEGPRFSTKAESNLFRMWGADVINMSIAPEAILANELGLEYAAIAMSTDYDCWKGDEAPVSWDEILKIFSQNAEKMKQLLLKAVEGFAGYDIEFIKSKIRTIPNYPKPGVMFRDITTLLGDPKGFERTMQIFEKRYSCVDIDLIAGIESRGFLIASALAQRLGKGIVLIRKKGKLPFETISEEYELEYGKDTIEMHRDAVKPGQRVLLVDDLIATGGTCAAAGNLIEKSSGRVVECAFVIDLPELKGSEKLRWPVFKIINFEGE